MPRLFTGIEIPGGIALELSLLQGGLPGARWITPENFHLTLRFIGDVDNATARAVADMMAGLGRAAFRLPLTGLHAFGGRTPRAIVALADPVPAIMELQAAHERALQRLGLTAEKRKFTPHVTLARLRGVRPRAVADYLDLRGGFRADPFPVERFVVFSARDTTGGGPYVVEQGFPLEPEHEDRQVAHG